MRIEKFEDVVAWQKAKTLNVRIYALLKNCRDFSFRDQLQRASVSIMNTIAEGFERRSDKELVNFLCIAKGSYGEVGSMLHLASELGYVKETDSGSRKESSLGISKIFSGCIKSV